MIIINDNETLQRIEVTARYGEYQAKCYVAYSLITDTDYEPVVWNWFKAVGSFAGIEEDRKILLERIEEKKALLEENNLDKDEWDAFLEEDIGDVDPEQYDKWLEEKDKEFSSEEDNDCGDACKI